MKKFMGILYVVALVIAMTISSCSSDRSADVRGILQTVPADASAVVVIDVKTLADKQDLKFDNNDMQDLVAAGAVEPSAAVFFTEGYNSYLTGYVADTDKFKAWTEKKFGEQFQKDSDMETCGNTLLNGNRFWLCITSRNTIKASDVKHFSSLSEKQSILVNETVAEMEHLSHAVNGWGDIKGCLNSAGLDFANRATATMVIESIFSDAVEFTFNADLDEKGVEADLNILNSKGGIAKFNFPTAKIDTSTIASLGGSAPGVMAIAVSPEMVKKLREETGGKGFSMIGVLANIITCVDGTCAAVFADADNVRGVISTTGHSTSDLSQMLQEFGMEVSMEGKNLLVHKGEVKGGINVKETANQFKGAMAGVVFSGEFKGMEKVKSIAVTLHPDKGGLSAHVKLLWKE